MVSGSGNWQNSNSFSLPIGTYILNAKIFTTPGTSSTTTYQYAFYSLSTASGNGGSKFINYFDTTTRLTETTTNTETYNVRNFTHIFSLTTGAPTLFFSAAFVYTVGGTGNQPQILSSPINIIRIA